MSNLQMIVKPTDAVPTPTAPKSVYNIDAEQALLGAILFDNNVLDRLKAPLSAEHFYDPVHGEIFSVAKQLIEGGRSATPSVISSYMSDHAGLKEIGAEKYLQNLAASVPSTLGAGDYATLIYDLALSRGIIDLTTQINERATHLDLDDDPMTIIESAEAGLYELAQGATYAQGFVDFKDSLARTMDSINAAFQRKGELAGFSTGIKSLDDKLGGLHQSDLIILAGRPSMGKTALATNWAVTIAEQYMANKCHRPNEYSPCRDGGVVGFFSLEMGDEQLTQRIIAAKAGISSDKLRRGQFEEADFERVYEAGLSLQQLPLHIDQTGAISVAQVAARARRLKRQKGLDILFIDYLQLMSPSHPTRGSNRTQEITEITMALKGLAKELDIPIIALSQLSRQLENRADKRPQLADLRESGSIEQDADVVMFVYREEYYLDRAEPDAGSAEHLEWQTKSAEAAGKAEIIIGKQRHGPIGKAVVNFDGATTTFRDIGHYYSNSDTVSF